MALTTKIDDTDIHESLGDPFDRCDLRVAMRTDGEAIGIGDGDVYHICEFMASHGFMASWSALIVLISPPTETLSPYLLEELPSCLDRSTDSADCQEAHVFRKYHLP